jgi:hypothetical protein
MGTLVGAKTVVPSLRGLTRNTVRAPYQTTSLVSSVSCFSTSHTSNCTCGNCSVRTLDSNRDTSELTDVELEISVQD